MGAVPMVMLSWNTARLLALVLNCLSGLMQYYEKEQLSNSLDMDAILGLRLLQGHLRGICELNTTNANGGFHPTILSTIRNLSHTAGDIAERALLSYKARDDAQYFNKFKSLVDKSPSVPFYPHRKLDERLRWGNKDILDRGTEHESGPWFVDVSNTPNHLHQCLSSLISDQCSMPPDCIHKFLTSKGLIGYDISRQVLLCLWPKCLHGKRTTTPWLIEKFMCQTEVLSWLATRTHVEFPIEPSRPRRAGCNDSLEKILKENGEKMSIDGLISERCTNIHDEMIIFRREKKKLARIANPSLDLMMEQVFVCLQYGYLEFANPHSLVTALAWQHPVLGCYTLQKPESIPNLGLSSGLNIISDNQSDQQGTCLLHTSTVVGLGIAMFLRFLLDPGPWPELRFVDQLVQIDQIVAEDHFEHFKYIDWVRDSNFPHEIRGMPRPPPMAWSPDLVAFMILLFFCIIGSVVGHHLLTSNKNYGRMGGKVKQMYPYSFKKL